MNILSFAELLRGIDKSGLVRDCVTSFAGGGNFPLEIEGCEGAFGALLLAKFYAARPGLYFVVVPQEGDAADLALDLASAGLPCMQFPLWGTAPYRELSPLSAVFGERVRVLGEIVAGRPGIVVIPQRAFLSPLPPLDYVKSLMVGIKPGQTLDSTALVQTLVSYGYTRVPRVQMRGEFALRGEVLDIFMGDGSGPGGDASAETESENGVYAESYRVLFDFDRIESIKRIELGGGPGRESLRELSIRPLREVIWTDDRIEALGDNLEALGEFSDGGKALVEELIARRGVEGEEMFYPLAFDRRASLLDYLGDSGTLVLVDRERLENAQESLEREYRNSYLRSQRETEEPGMDARGREYPLPERLLLNIG
ncbi:MAG: transcription-repair coupling factor, partial [Treponema sp.]|nr:transcription-repair coupling factor [Treponema sp.]